MLYLGGIVFYVSEDYSTFIFKVVQEVILDMASHPRRLESSATLL
jgi:hypothetical protein